MRMNTIIYLAALLWASPSLASDDADVTKLKDTLSCEECNLSFANLSRANLTDANLKSANLSFANLSRANLSRANLKGADLTGTKFCGTKTPDVFKNNSGC
jgi:uncharacterized protein YjbI with pentapeptide repeats